MKSIFAETRLIPLINYVTFQAYWSYYHKQRGLWKEGSGCCTLNDSSQKSVIEVHVTKVAILSLILIFLPLILFLHVRDNLRFSNDILFWNFVRNSNNYGHLNGLWRIYANIMTYDEIWHGDEDGIMFYFERPIWPFKQTYFL